MNDSVVVSEIGNPSGGHHVKDLNEKFGRFIKQLGVNNRKGTLRYSLEVNFAYALNEIDNCPIYLQGKMTDLASSVVNDLLEVLRKRREEGV